MVGDDDDKHLLLLLSIVIFLITTIGGSTALNTSINETHNTLILKSDFEDKNGLFYSINSEFLKVKTRILNESKGIKAKNEYQRPIEVQAAPENVSQNNATIQNSVSSSIIKWDLNGTKTVYLTSDNIIDKKTDMKFLKRVASDLENNGINVIIDPYAPNPNQVPRSIKNAPSESVVVIINYNCAGTIKDLCDGISGPRTNGNANEGYLYNYAKDLNGIIYVNISPETILKDSSYLPRAYDDGFSPNSFKGINDPAQYLLENGIELIDSPKPTYPVMSAERADIVSQGILELIN